MLINLRRSFIFAVAAIVLVFAYTLVGTGLSQLAFKHQADGSVTAKGSTLIGQNWSSPKWFHGRPDDTGPYAANPKTHVAGGDNPGMNNGISGESAATNLGPRSATLLANTQALVAYWHKMGVNPTPDLVTTSGSGYDPDISAQDAIVQIPMVSKATGISPSRLTTLINRQNHGAQLGFLGSSYVNVLQLNEALAKLR
ncbi:MAG: Potassium-transporting ATPase [Acidimicrobiaceae bacterium]|nr:Potassium-transporting ATPase [Acidimicrobiaceae bacterium]